MILKTYYISQSIIEEFSKAYFPAKNQKGTAEATKGMMRLLSLGHLSFRIIMIKTTRCDKSLAP